MGTGSQKQRQTNILMYVHVSIHVMESIYCIWKFENENKLMTTRPSSSCQLDSRISGTLSIFGERGRASGEVYCG